jgi:hypothetical protein
MEKKSDIKKKFFNFKNSLINDYKKLGFWIYIGSFFRDNRKYITDIDIEFRLKNIRVSDYINEIINIYDKLKNYNTVKFLDDLKIFDEERKEMWNYNELVQGYKIINNDKKYLKDLNILKVNYNLILKLKNYYIDVDFVISHKNNKEKLERKIYNVNINDKFYNRGDYYKYIKKMKVSYYLLVRDKSSNYSHDELDKMKQTADEIKAFINNKDFTISKYHLNKTLLKLKKMSSDELTYGFNKLFAEYAEKVYNSKVIKD